MRQLMAIKSLAVPAKLYVGVTEEIAKVAPTKGLSPVSFLTNIYPGHFCLKYRKWGIVTVKTNMLCPDMFGPFHLYVDKHSKSRNKDVEARQKKILDNILKYKDRWQQSLSSCGICTYAGNVPAYAIAKVTIFDSAQNSLIKSLVEMQVSPFEISPQDHKALYHKNLGITRWLAGEMVTPQTLYPEQGDFKKLCEIGEKILDRESLEVFYQNDGRYKSYKNVG